jgi:hypothetical protein
MAVCNSPPMSVTIPASSLPSAFIIGAYINISGVTPASAYGGIFQITGVTSTTLTYAVTCSGPGTIASSASVQILPRAGGQVCGGSTCVDHSGTNPTAVVAFTGIKHTERAQDGTYVTGAVIYTDMSPTCPSAGYTQMNCVHFDGVNQPLSYLVQNLANLSGARTSIQDDAFSTTITDSVVPYYAGGSSGGGTYNLSNLHALAVPAGTTFANSFASGDCVVWNGLGSLADGGGPCPATVGNYNQSLQHASIGTATLYSTPATPSQRTYLFSYALYQDTAGGGSCGGSAGVQLTANWADSTGAESKSFLLPFVNSFSTTNHTLGGTLPIRAVGSSSVTFSTTYSSTGCTTTPTYSISVNIQPVSTN